MTRPENEKNFLELYDQYVGKIYRYIYFRIGTEEQAQDLTSEVFLKSWQYLGDKKDLKDKVKNPRAFFYQIARNLIADFYRQQDRSPISLDEIADKFIVDKSEALPEQMEKQLEIESIKRSLMYLTPDHQEVIIWRYLEDLETKEIADILEKSEGAVRVLLSRALGELKTFLSKKQ